MELTYGIFAKKNRRKCFCGVQVVNGKPHPNTARLIIRYCSPKILARFDTLQKSWFSVLFWSVGYSKKSRLNVEEEGDLGGHSEEGVWGTVGLFFFLSRLRAQRGTPCGAWTPNAEIKTWAKIKSRALNGLSHPGFPFGAYLKSVRTY